MPGTIPLFQSSEFWWISESVWRKTLLTLGFVNLKRNDENLSSLWSQTPNVGFLSQWKERLWFPNHPKKHLRSKQDPLVAHGNLWVDCFWPQEIWTHAHAHIHTHTHTHIYRHTLHYITSNLITSNQVTSHHHTYIHTCMHRSFFNGAHPKINILIFSSHLSAPRAASACGKSSEWQRCLALFHSMPTPSDVSFNAPWW